jgi:hypothetical protein
VTWLDPIREYGDPADGYNQQKLNCKMCGKEMMGGISRLIYHLAQILGHEVGICSATTPEIIQIANKSL